MVYIDGQKIGNQFYYWEKKKKERKRVALLSFNKNNINISAKLQSFMLLKLNYRPSILTLVLVFTQKHGLIYRFLTQYILLHNQYTFEIY